MDPRKKILRPETAAQDQMRDRALDHLLHITETASEDLGITGASFVVMGIAIWGGELSQLDQRAAAKMFQAIGTLYDPAATPRQKEVAEIKRKKAVDKLFAAIDLEMSKPEGTA
jgi:hypothetical protein